MKKAELRDVSSKLGKLNELVRDPKYRKQKWPFPTEFPKLKVTQILSLAQDVVDMIVEMKCDEPEEDEYWLVEISNGERVVGQVSRNRTIYRPGWEEDSEVRRFVRKIDTKN